MKQLKTQWWQSPVFRIDAAGLSVVLLASGLAYAMAIDPFIRRNESVDAVQLELEQSRRSISAARLSLQSAQRRVAELQSKRSAAPLVLKPVAELNGRMTRLAELARSPAAGLKLTETVASVPKVEPRYTAVPLKLAGSGTYVGVASFLSQLHEQFRDLRVVSLRVSGNPGDAAGVAQFSVELVWFAAPEKSADFDDSKASAGVTPEK